MFQSCMWIFILQMVLVALIYKEVVLDVDHFRIEIHGFEVFLCQFLACNLLHMELIQEVK